MGRRKLVNAVRLSELMQAARPDRSLLGPAVRTVGEAICAVGEYDNDLLYVTRDDLYSWAQNDMERAKAPDAVIVVVDVSKDMLRWVRHAFNHLLDVEGVAGHVVFFMLSDNHCRTALGIGLDGHPQLSLCPRNMGGLGAVRELMPKIGVLTTVPSSIESPTSGGS